MDGVPVEFKKPEKTFYAERDASFDLRILEAFGPSSLQIVSDSILIIQKQPDDASPYFFLAYSIRTLRYLGSFSQKGRGPGETISPNMAAVSSSASYLYIRDSFLKQSWEVDVMSSIRAGTMVYALTIPALDSGPIWIPVGDSLFFSYDRKGKELFYKVLTIAGEEYKSFSPFRGMDFDRYFTQMSEIPTGEGVNGRLAFPMVFFPMLHYWDIENGQWRAIAVDPDWRKWRKLLQEPMNLEKMEYYAGAASSAKYIVALFQKRRLGDGRERGTESEVHFFDWEGNFLYRIIVGDDLKGVTFDSNDSCLYGIDRVTGQILRYNLSSILYQ